MWKEIFLPVALIACTPLLVCFINDIQYAVAILRDFLEWRKTI